MSVIHVTKGDNIIEEVKNESADNESILAVSALKQIECKCGESNLLNDKLYLCENKQCSADYYCESCGPFYHNTSKKSKLDHSFDINSSNVTELNDLMNKKADIQKFNDGKQMIIDLIGYERYNRIAPYVRMASIGVSNAGMITELMFDLKDFYNMANLSIEANYKAHQAIVAANNASLALQRANQAKDIVSEVSYLKPWTWTWGKTITNTDATQLTQIAEKAQNTADKAKNAANVASNTAESALKQSISLENSINTMKAGLCGVAIATAFEMIIHTYRYCNDDINGKEWCRLLGKACIRNTASLVGTGLGSATGVLLSMKVGTMVGSATLPGIGTVVGCGTGIIVGMVSGFLMGKGAESVYIQYFPENEKEAKSKMLNEALLYFHFQEKDTENQDIFNDKILRKKFRQNALYAHPDRRAGDYSEWQRLSIYYGILRGVLEQRTKPKNETNQKIIQKVIQSVPNTM